MRKKNNISAATQRINDAPSEVVEFLRDCRHFAEYSHGVLWNRVA